MNLHVPVMLRECIDPMPLGPGALAVDGTVGHGGHASELARRISPGGTLVATDWDPEMLAVAAEVLRPFQGQVELEFHPSDYRGIPALLGDRRAAGILLDLGLNSGQLDDPQRGLAIQTSGPLDLRMDRVRAEPAAAWLNRAAAPEIERVLREFGDERWAGPISRKIVERRARQPLSTTDDLVDCVLAAIPPAKRERRIHPATRTFQAVRIYINSELTRLQEAIEQIGQCLAPGGVMAVLSYHSGEDRAAKRAFKALDGKGWTQLTKRPLQPGAAEVRANRRSRSAKLRLIKKEDTDIHGNDTRAA